MTNEPGSWFIGSVDLEPLLVAANERMKDEGIPVPARPIRAAQMISKDLGLHLLFGGFETPIPLLAFEWFKQRYGGRVDAGFQLGRMVVLVDRDPFLVVFPIAYGPIQVNPLEWIQDLTGEIAHALDEETLARLCHQLIEAFDPISSLNRVPYQLVADMETAVFQIMNYPPELGLSRWASQQVVEKLLKAYLRASQVDPGMKHNLAYLAQLSEENGLPALDRHDLEVVGCKASVRYGKIPTSLANAVEAHHISIRIGAVIAGALSQFDPEKLIEGQEEE